MNEEQNILKKIIFGKTGYGKSLNYVAPIINNNENVLLITPNISVENELKYMGIESSMLNNISFKDIHSIQHGKYGVLINNRPRELFGALIDNIETSGISEKENFTIIFTNTIMLLDSFNILQYIRRLNKWKCNIILEHTCGTKEEADVELKLNCLSLWNDWLKVPVFEKCSKSTS